MKRFRIISIIGTLIVCCAMFGCGKEDPETTTIYGTVFNSVTHEPIIGAQIEVGYRTYPYSGSGNGYYQDEYDHAISSSVSGVDGQFELQFGKVNIVDESHFKGYYIYSTAMNYYNDFRITGISIGSNYRIDVNLKPK